MKNKTKNSISKRELFLLSLILVTAVTVVCWNLYGSNIYSDIRCLKTELYTMETEIDNLKTLHDKQKEIGNKWMEFESLSYELQTSLPSEKDLPQVLERLETALATYRQLISSFRIAELYPGDKLSTADISISAAGPAQRLERLLYDLERFPSSLVFKSLDWVNQDAGQATAYIELRLLFYQTPGLNEPEKEIEVP